MSASNTNPGGNPLVSDLTIAAVATTNPAGNPIIAELSNGTTFPSSAGVQQIQHDEEVVAPLEPTG